MIPVKFGILWANFYRSGSPGRQCSAFFNYPSRVHQKSAFQVHVRMQVQEGACKFWPLKRQISPPRWGWTWTCQIQYCPDDGGIETPTSWYYGSRLTTLPTIPTNTLSSGYRGCRLIKGRRWELFVCKGCSFDLIYPVQSTDSTKRTFVLISIIPRQLLQCQQWRCWW